MNEQLATLRNKTIEALLLTNTIVRAAKRANVSEASIYRWMKQKSFQTALRAARRDILAHTTTRRHRRHHRTTQNPRSATAEPSEWISRGRKQLQSRGRKPAVKRPEEPGMWPAGGFRIPAAQVRPRARPRILFATSGQAGSDRVEAGIGQRCHQMIATQCTRKEAVLPQVSAAAVEPVSPHHPMKWRFPLN